MIKLNKVMSIDRQKTMEKNDTCYKYDYVLELWNASTKHPDSIFKYSDWEDKTNLFDDEYQIYQWLLYCASRLTFPFYAKELVEYATKYYYKEGGIE